MTLPGIAGLSLTVGMSVDNNILINERIREEIHLGKSMRAAVEAGRLARLAGRIPKLAHAEPSSPQFGLVGT